MPNPLIALGTLNRLQAAVTWATNPNLNITASFLGKRGIRLALESRAVTYIDVMTGGVPSPEPYMKISMRMNLLKSQTLSDLYRQQMESNVLLGDGNVYPDVPPGIGLGIYAITNCSISSVEELDFSGATADFNVMIEGFYLVNSVLWD